jgi:CO dehydrogenase maturation factor
LAKIAIAGKGGSGKTTLAGTLARLLGRKGQEVWAIDADSNPNLAVTLGLPRERLPELAPLPSSLLAERFDDQGKRSLVLATSPSDVVRQHGVPVADRVTLLLMGQVDHAGAG